MPEQERTISYTPTRGDIFAFQLRAMRRNRVLMALLALAWLFCLYMELETGRSAGGSVATASSTVKMISAILAGSVIFTSGLLLMLAVLWLMIRAAKFKGFLTEQTLTITNNGLASKSASGESLRKWSSIDKITSTRRHLIIYWNESMATIIPKRCFPSPAGAAAFEEELRKRMKGGQD